MRRLRVGLSALAVSAAAACGGGNGPESSPAPPVGACAPIEAALPEGATLAGMDGSYRLAMVSADGVDTTEGTIRLQVRQGDLGNRDGTATPLGGTADIDLASVGAQAVSGLSSDDPAAPGVLVLESATGSAARIIVRLGSEANSTRRQAFDGAFTVLEPRSIAGGGFFGGWRSGSGADRSSGYFCAWPEGD